jgi:glucose dehydrogenase
VKHLNALVSTVIFGGVAIAGAVIVGTQGRTQPIGEWPYFGGNHAYTRYSALDQINRNNVKNLKIVWRLSAENDKVAALAATAAAAPAGGGGRAGGGGGGRGGGGGAGGNNYLRATPIMVGGVLYTQDSEGLVMAVDGGTGKVLWRQELPSADDASGRATRGVDFWRGGAGNLDKRIFAIRGEYLYAVEAESGKLVPGFGDHGRSSLHVDDNPLAGRFGDSTGPLVVGNVVVITGTTGGAGDTGTFRKEAAPQDVRGFDAVSGKLIWTFHVVPREGEFGTDTWGKDEQGVDSWRYAGDLGAWNQMTSDEELGMVYIPLTAPTASSWGGWRPGDNLFSDCLVALDIKTGKRVWHFQTVHHDLWETDLVGPAMLGDITVNGKKIKAVMQPSKNGFLWVLDRTNGKPVWPVEERPVPQSTVAGEHTSPTQPFPTKPPPMDRQGIGDDDLIDYTPELKAKAREIAAEYVLGPLYTPPSLIGVPGAKKGTIMQPGSYGSTNFHTGAFDPETGMYYAVTHSLPQSNRAIAKTTQANATMPYYGVGQPPNIPDGASFADGGLPIIKGPYGRITAFNLNTGDQAWMVPNGDGPRNSPQLKGLNLPPLGIPNRPAPLLTKTLLFLGEGSNAIEGTPQADWAWGKKFRAYDKKTGQVIAEMELPSGTTAGPMTYMLAGKQYIVVPIGARDHPAEYVALALP